MIVWAVSACGIGAVLVSIGIFLGVRHRAPQAVEDRFRSAFARIGEEGREAVISRYANRFDCSRDEAMRRALKRQRARAGEDAK